MAQFGEKPAAPSPPSYDDGSFPTIPGAGEKRRQFTPKQPIVPKDPLDDMDLPPNTGPSDKDLLQHIGLLMQHGHDPEVKKWFDQKYGAGVSDIVLQKVREQIH